MLTEEQIAAIKAKPESERTQEEKDALLAAERKSDNEHMIPKSRFDDVNEKNKQLQKQLDAANTEKEKREREALESQNKYKELYEAELNKNKELTTKANQVDEYEETLKTTLKTQLEDVPEGLRGLVPEQLSTRDKLEWISKNKAVLVKPSAIDVGANGKNKGKKTETTELTAGQKETARRFGMSDDEYAKFIDTSAPETETDASKEK